jgi:hypothetical protein
LKLTRKRGEKQEKQDQTESKSRFSRFKNLVERNVRRVAAVAALSVTLVFAGCGGETNDRDGGRDADADQDAGPTDGGTDGDIVSPCELYANGSDNRIELFLGQSVRPDCDEYALLFSKITSMGNVMLMGFNHVNPGRTDWHAFEEAVPKEIEVPSVGTTTVEICQIQGGPCEYVMGGDPIGDPNCSITVAVDRRIRCY